jgi:putative ABC transport system permease protein
MVAFYEPQGETRPETISLRKLHLQPIADIHLHSKLEKEMNANSDITYIYIFSFIAFFILILAAVNFINISTTQSFGRVKEIGVRKVVGAKKNQLVHQFLTDSVLTTFIAMLIALLLFAVAIPYYSDLTAKPFLRETIFTISNFGILLLLLGALDYWPVFILHFLYRRSILSRPLRAVRIPVRGCKLSGTRSSYSSSSSPYL